MRRVRVLVVELEPPPFGEDKESETVGVHAADCSTCGKRLDGITSVAHRRDPGPGDITICAYCGQLYELAIDATSTTPLVRRPINDDAFDASMLDTGQAEALERVRRAIAHVQRNKGREA